MKKEIIKVLVILFAIFLIWWVIPFFLNEFEKEQQQTTNTTAETNDTQENTTINLCYNKTEYVQIGRYTKEVCNEEYILRKDGFYDKVETACRSDEYLQVCSDHNINCLFADETFYEKRVTQECQDIGLNKHEFKFYNLSQ